MFELDAWVIYQDEDLGRQLGQVIRRFKIKDGEPVYCIWGKIRGGFTGDVCYQIRWQRPYSHELPGSIHESRLGKASALEVLAAQA